VLLLLLLLLLLLSCRQTIINFIRCALYRGARVFSRMTCRVPLVFEFSRIAATSETKRFLLHFATRHRGWKLRPTKHFVLQRFHRPPFPLYLILSFSLFLFLSLCLFLSYRFILSLIFPFLCLPIAKSPHVSAFPHDFHELFAVLSLAPRQFSSSSRSSSRLVSSWSLHALAIDSKIETIISRREKLLIH